MVIQKVQITEKSVYLNTDFGMDLAVKKLNMTEDEIVKIVGRYSKGKHKGEIKGKLIWFKIVEDGWFYACDCVTNMRQHTYGYRVVDYRNNNILGGIENDVNYCRENNILLKHFYLSIEIQKKHDMQAEKIKPELIDFDYGKMFNVISDVNKTINNWSKAREYVISAVDKGLVDVNILEFMKNGLLDTLKNVKPPLKRKSDGVDAYLDILEKVNNLDIS